MRKKAVNFLKLLLVIFLLHVVTDWKENVQAFKLAYAGKPFYKVTSN